MNTSPLPEHRQGCVWQTSAEHQKTCVRLGRTERLEKYPFHRAYPETGEWPQECRTWTAAVEWLLSVHQGHLATSDAAAGNDAEATPVKATRVKKAG